MIKSSFKKKENVGTKDSNYFYFGSPDLDFIFSNQLMRGTIMLIEEDYPTRHYLSLLRLFIGCGIHQKQKVILYDLLGNRWQTLIPVLVPPKTEVPSEENKEGQSDKSKIAWRYDNMEIKLKEKNPNKEIPIMDLSKNVDITTQEFQEQKILEIISPKTIKTYRELFDHIYNKLLDSLTDSNDKSFKRFVFPNFFTTFCQLPIDIPQIIKFFHTLRVFARSTYSTFVFSLRAEEQVLLTQLRSIFDYVIGLEVLQSKESFEDFQGFVRLVKVPSINKFVSHPHDAKVFGFKTDKKKFSQFDIEKLYLNPEKDNSALTGEKKEGPLLCSTTPATKEKFEF